MSPTLKDVAERAGVSYATVSRVLANKPNIREATRQRVLRAVKETGYRPNRTARSLRARSSRIIGVIISDIVYDFFPPMVRAIEDHVAAHDFALFLCNSDEDPAKEKHYVNLLVEENVAGVIIAPTVESSDSVGQLLDVNIPVVSVDRRIKNSANIDSVVINNAKAAFELVDHLVSNGYERIGAVMGSPEFYTARERCAGYRQALEHHGIAIDEELIATAPPTTANGYALTMQMLRTNPPPAALLTSNHLLASGAFMAIKESGLNIPNDIALVTFDNSYWTALVEPGLTVAAQPVYDLGAMAARLLIDRITAPESACQNVALDAEIIIRGSSLPHNQ